MQYDKIPNIYLLIKICRKNQSYTDKKFKELQRGITINSIDPLSLIFL